MHCVNKNADLTIIKRGCVDVLLCNQNLRALLYNLFIFPSINLDDPPIDENYRQCSRCHGRRDMRGEV